MRRGGRRQNGKKFNWKIQRTFLIMPHSGSCMKDKMKTQNLHPAKGERPRIRTWMKTAGNDAGQTPPSIFLEPVRIQSLLTLSVVPKTTVFRANGRPFTGLQSSAMEPWNPLLPSALQAQPSSSLQHLQQGLQNPWSFYVGSERAEEGSARLSRWTEVLG